MSDRRTSSSDKGAALVKAAPSRSTTNDLFPALDRSAQVATLQQLFDAHEGYAFPLGTALTLGAAIAERVAIIHTAGRFVGALDARRIRVSVDGRVSLARVGEGSVAPELLRGGSPSIASDVFAVAYLVHQLLTGSAPVPGIAVPPSRFNAQLDAEMDSVLLAALRDEPAERPASVMAVQGALEGLGEELGLKTDLAAIGALVKPLLVAPLQVAAPAIAPLTALERLTAAWLAAPGPHTDFGDDEELDDEVTHATVTRPTYALFACGAALAAILMTIVTYSLARAPEADEVGVPQRRVVAPVPQRAAKPKIYMAGATESAAPSSPKMSSTPATAPAAARPVKRKHRSHR